MESGLITSESALINATTAWAASLTLRIGASNCAGKSGKRPAFVGSLRTSLAKSVIASANASAAFPKASAALPGICFFAIFAARSTRPAVSSSVTACVVRSINSCASSKITASRSGKIGCESTISIASKVWFVTTTSAVWALALAFTAKHLLPNAQSSLPMHSRPDTEFAYQTRRSTSGASSRSPDTPGVSAQARNRLASFSSAPISINTSPSGSAPVLFIFCKQR